MQLVTILESDMKKGKNYTEAELDELIVRLKDKDFLTWEAIAEEIQKRGYVSKRTGRPLSISTIRYHYMYGEGKPTPYRSSVNKALASVPGAVETKFPPKAASAESDKVLDLIQQFMNLSTSDSEKLNLIKTVLKR